MTCELTKGQKASRSSPYTEFLVDNMKESYRRLKHKRMKFVEKLNEKFRGGRKATFMDPEGNILKTVQINKRIYFAVLTEGDSGKS